MLTVTVDDTQLIKTLNDMPRKIRESLYKTVYALALKLQKHIVVNKLQGQVLGKRTGALQRSIQNEVVQNNQGTIGRVFSSGDVKYAAFWEYGGIIPPHIIMPKHADALAFMMNGKQVFAKKVMHPGYTAAPRSFMRSSLRDMRSEILDSIQRAIGEATKL